MRRFISAIGFVLGILAGCTTFHGVEPIYPEAVGVLPTMPFRVDGLRPTFQWRPVPGAASYDLVIYRGIKTESWQGGINIAMGKEVYYREALPGPQHRIEVTLEPGSIYFWSVRTRHGSQVSEWSRYDYTAFLGTMYITKENAPFMFYTPG